MTVASHALLNDRPGAADRALRAAAGVTVGYLALALVPMALYVRHSGDAGKLALHGVVLCMALVLFFSRDRRLTPFADWLPLLAGPFLYIEQRWLIAGLARPHGDAIVRGWETALFPSDPSRSLAVAYHGLLLSETLHLAYLSYYALVYLPPAILYLRGHRSSFATTMLALAIVYGLCFALFLFFPVDGPRFLHGPANAPDGLIRTIVLRILEGGSSRGTAFPSSHVAASFVAAVCALRFQRRLGIVVAVFAAGVPLGAVYGGYHYAVDVVAGAVAACVALLLARGLERHWGLHTRATPLPTATPELRADRPAHPSPPARDASLAHRQDH